MTPRADSRQLVVRRLLATDDRSGFQSGNVDLDRFFQRFAGQNQFRHHVGTTWVALTRGHIVGFATVSAAQLEVGLLPEKARKRLPAYPLPVLRLARLAVSNQAQGAGVGRALLRAVFTLAWRMADDLGCIGIVVDAKSEAIGFYETLGFQELEHRQGGLGDRPEPVPMFLELAAVPKPVDPPAG
jgi:GNAT superfamily N-acetyltransferase